MSIPNYKMAQNVLYSTCRIAWGSCLQFLLQFALFRARYTEVYINEQLDAVDAAEALQVDQARTAEAEIFHNELIILADGCTDNWQRLKRYIMNAYTVVAQKAKLEEAGAKDYERAAHHDWDAVQSLNSTAHTFITNNLVQLQADDNMPTAFVTKFDADRAAFSAKHLAFIHSEENSEIGTQTKITANNALYTALMPMLLDGQEIFKHQDAERKQFVLAEIIEHLSGVGTAGIRGTLTSSLNNMPIINVDVMVLINSFATTTNQQGKYELSPMAAGKYDVRFSAPGYHDKVINLFDVLTGTISTLDVQLDPL